MTASQKIAVDVYCPLVPNTCSIALPSGIALVLLCIVSLVLEGIICVPRLSPVALTWSVKERMLQEAPVSISKVTL